MQENKVKISDLMSKRIDPYYYNEEFQNLIKKLKQTKNICSVGTLIKSWNRGDGPREGFYTDDYQSGVPFIRINNLKQNSIDVSDIKYIYRNIHETRLKRTKVTANNLIFAISGTKENLGTVAIIPDTIKEANLNSALVRLDLDNLRISNKYFCVLFSLKFVRMQINYIGKGAAQNNLNNEEISQILIPVPSLDLQEQIVKIMSDANIKRQEKYDNAKNLLESINDILLKELNIIIPKIDDKKEFKTTISNILGSRLDPKYHQPKYETLAKYIKTNIKDLYSLEDICDEVISGQRPKGGVSQVKEGIPSLGGEHVLRDGTIETKNLKFIPEDFHKKQIKSKIKPLDIILVKDGATTGKVGIIPEEYPFKEANINEHVFILRCKKHINPYYILAFLLSEIGQTQIEREISGATIMGITKDSLKNILIPLPSPNTQILIANEYNMRLEQAQNLKKEADEEFEKSKARVERIILGEENL